MLLDVSAPSRPCPRGKAQLRKDNCTSWYLNQRPLAICGPAVPLPQRLVTSVSCELYRNITFCVSRKHYLAYVRKATLDLDDLGQRKLVGCRTNYNRSKIFLSPSFVEVLQLGIVAKKQGFPNCATLRLTPEIARDTEPAMKLAKMLAHICARSH